MDTCSYVWIHEWMNGWDDGEVKAGELAWIYRWRLRQTDKDKGTSQTSSSLQWLFLSCWSWSDGGPSSLLPPPPPSSLVMTQPPVLQHLQENLALCWGRIPLWGWTDFSWPPHPVTQLETGLFPCPPAVAEE